MKSLESVDMRKHDHRCIKKIGGIIMFTYLKTMANVKLGQKGALFVEYALILAFVVIVGALFLSDGGLKDSISTIFSKTASELNAAAAK